MADLGFNLLIGAALTSTVGQAFTSIKKQASLTIKDTEKLQLGKKWAEEIQDLTKRLKLNKEEMRQVGRTAENIQIRKELVDRLSEAKTEAAKFGVNLANAGEKAAEFNKKINFNTSIEGLGSAFSEMKAGITRGLGGLAKAGVMGVGLSKTVSSFGNVAAEFEKGMAKVSTLVDTNETDMNKLSKNAREMAKSFGFSTNQVSEGMYQALSAGVEVKDLGGFMNTAGKMAVGGSIDMATAIDGMTSAVNAYGAANLSAQKASDIMFQTAKRGKTDVGKLAATLSNVTPIASSIGVKFGDVSAAIATLTYSGTPTSTATIGIANALTELSKDGTDASKMFRRLTGQSFKDYIASGHNMGEAFNVISQGAKMQNVELVDLLHNTSGAKAVMTLTGAAAGRFSEDLKEMGNSAGATEEAFDKMRKTTAQRMAEMQAGLDDVKLTIGEAFVPAMLSIGQAVSKIMTPIGDFIAQNPTLVENITWATAAAIGFYGALKLGLIINAVVKGVKLASEAYKKYKATTEGATFIQWAFNTAMHANPIGLIIAGVLALGVAIYAVYKNWDDIKTWVIEHFDTIMKYLKWFAFPIWAIIKLAKTVYDNWEPIMDWFSEKIEWFSNKIDLLRKGWNMIFGGGTATITAVSKIEDLNSGKSSGSISVAKDIPLQTNVRNEKNVNVSMPNITINSANLDESLPTITEKVRAAVMAGARDDMENSYAY